MWQNFLTDEKMLDRENHRQKPEYWTGASPYGIVSTAHYRATAVGVEILTKGGNAIDAAVACSLALGVVEPAGSGLGGMTMMMIHLAATGKTFIIEGPCRAPIHATPEAVAAAPRKRGYKAVAVPANPGILEYALQNYGSVSLKNIIEPVIRLTTNGYPITPLQYRNTKASLKFLAKGTAGQFFLDTNKKPIPPGTIFRQPVLANTLQRLATAGFRDFYDGEIAERIVADMVKNEGFICDRDLAEFPEPEEIDPLCCQFGDWTVCSMPPPGGGTTLLQMIQLFNQLKPHHFDPDSPEAAVLFASIIRRARFDRRKYRLGTASKEYPHPPDLTSPGYAEIAAAEIRMESSEAGETSHLCIFDRHQNVVSLTQSIERSFGAKVATRDLGFLYNGFMKTFKIQNKRHPFYLKPGAKARSNATPTIVFRHGLPIYAIGSTGSERMASGIFQVLVRLKYQTSFEAVMAPRLHCTPEGEVFVEQERFNRLAIEALKAHGFKVYPYEAAWSFKAGGLQLASFDGTIFSGVAEPRRDGACAGPDYLKS